MLLLVGKVVGAPHGKCFKIDLWLEIVAHSVLGSPDVIRPGSVATRDRIEIALTERSHLQFELLSSRTSCSFGTQTRWRLGHPKCHDLEVGRNYETASMWRPYAWLRHALIAARFACLSGFCDSLFLRGDELRP